MLFKNRNTTFKCRYMIFDFPSQKKKENDILIIFFWFNNLSNIHTAILYMILDIKMFKYARTESEGITKNCHDYKLWSNVFEK